MSGSWLVLIVLVLILVGCAGPLVVMKDPTLETVPQVDLERYMGVWYEIARLPNSFQEGCTATSATYGLRPDGTVDVENRCRRGSIDGPEKTAHGRAQVVNPADTARLRVTFVRPFSGDYWIIDLGPNYEYAVVGTPNRSYLWILSRRRRMDEQLYQALVDRATTRGFDTSLLIRTLQPED